MNVSPLKTCLHLMFAVVAIGAAYAVGRWPGLDFSSKASTPASPGASVNAAARIPEYSDRRMSSPRTMTSLVDAQDAWQAINAGNLPPGARNREEAIIQLLRSMNPPEAATLAITLPAGAERQSALNLVGREWSRLDGPTAFAWASQLPEADAQAVLKSLMTKGLGPLPYEAAKAYVDKLSDPALRDQAMMTIATSQAAQGDPAGALTWISQRATGANLQKAVEGIFRAMAEPPVQITINGGQVSSSWGGNKQDLGAAAELLGIITDPAMRSSAIGILADGWGKTDLNTALAWAQALPDSDATARSAALNGLVTSMAKSDPAAAVAFIKNAADPSAYMTIAPTVTAALAQYDPQGAYAFAQSLPEGATKEQSLGNVLVTMGATDFTSAWGYATALPNGAARDAAMQGLVGVEAQKDPAHAAALMAEFTPGSEAARYGLHNLIPSWARLDPRAASEWMNTLSDSQGRNIAIVQFVTTMGGKDPVASMKWVNSISDDTTRINNVKRVLGKWPATDPAGELNAIQTANITEDQRATLLNSFLTRQSAAK